eukprot:NODE_127_length_18646_cov_0.421632.p7 type:complete len:157 gc:universal NODE_127_length_18646_cov_0.421632:6746-7216(+)
MLSQLFLSTILAFDLAIGQFGDDLSPGNEIKFDLYYPAGGKVPSSTEKYDVNLLDGRFNTTNAEVVTKLAEDLTQTKGISLKLPSNLESGPKYFLQIVAKSGESYSAPFSVISDDPSTGGSPASEPTETSTEDADITGSASKIAAAAIILTAMNIF